MNVASSGRSRMTRLPAASGRARGRALLSYLAEPVSWPDRDRRLRGHTNTWESREIARALSERDLDVDAIDFSDEEFEPDGHYDVVVALHSELHRLAEAAEASIPLMHHTGAYPSFQNAAELRRIEQLYERRGVRCVPRRQVEEGPAYDRCLREERASSLLGNEWTLSTYPAEVRPKITCVPATGSSLVRVRSARTLVPKRREFIWYFGSGAIHKGLDRALEAFANQPGLVLHVVGNIGDEQDFIDAYHRELFELPNIHWHGFLDPRSRRFRRLVRDCFCVVAPTCSEGTSPATLTMLQLGLYPLISRECGITLPGGAGTYLETCEVAEIEQAAGELRDLPEPDLREQTRATQAMALERHSRTAFARTVREYLDGVVEEA
jgi:glycosyltransferase involved in cell wall biosynthesis